MTFRLEHLDGRHTCERCPCPATRFRRKQEIAGENRRFPRGIRFRSCAMIRDATALRAANRGRLSAMRFQEVDACQCVDVRHHHTLRMSRQPRRDAITLALACSSPGCGLVAGCTMPRQGRSRLRACSAFFLRSIALQPTQGEENDRHWHSPPSVGVLRATSIPILKYQPRS
jgi:hypothetical protein